MDGIVKKIEKISRLVTIKRLAILMCLVVVATLIPLLYLARYNVPCADDFNPGINNAWQENHSISALLSMTVRYTKHLWLRINSLYSIGIISFFAPFVVDGNHWLHAHLAILSLCFSTMFVLFTVFRKVFNADAWPSLLIASTMSMWSVQIVHDMVQAFYWYSSATTYTIGNSLFFLVAGLTVLLIYGAGKRFRIFYLIFCPIVIIIYGGANLTTSFGSVGFFCSLVCFLLFLKNKMWKIICIPTFFSVASLLVTALGPGMRSKQQIYIGVGHPAPSVIRMFAYALALPVHSIGSSLRSWDLLGVIIFLIPVFVIIARKSKFRFRYPLIVSVFSYLYFASLLCPNLYADSTLGPMRSQNVFRYFLVIIMTLNVCYWVGWITQKFLLEPLSLRIKLQEKKVVAQMQQPLIIPLERLSRKYVLFVLLIPLLVLGYKFATEYYLTGDRYKYSTPSALIELRLGIPQAYYSEYLTRLEILRDPEIKDAVLKQYVNQPKSLYYPNHDVITYFPQYYHKDSVVFDE